jgi:hypothetical protein
MNIPSFFNNTILDITIERVITFFVKAVLIYAITQIAVSVTKYLYRL